MLQFCYSLYIVRLPSKVVSVYGKGIQFWVRCGHALKAEPKNQQPAFEV
jgi:hypothetical protein